MKATTSDIARWKAKGLRVVGEVAKPKVKKQYRSKTEGLYAALLQMRLKAGEIKAWYYEPVTFKLAEGLKYTPDFAILNNDDRIEMIEVKGAFVRRSGIDKVKMFRGVYPCIEIKMMQWKGGVWGEIFS